MTKMLTLTDLDKSRKAMRLPSIVVEDDTGVGAVEMKIDRVSRIHKLLKNRDEGEQEIAKLLREEKDALGEEKWLELCEREWGWKKSTAYLHLNPEQLKKNRERAQEFREKHSPYRMDSATSEAPTDSSDQNEQPDYDLDIIPSEPQRSQLILTSEKRMQMLHIVIEFISSRFDKSRDDIWEQLAKAESKEDFEKHFQ